MMDWSAHYRWSCGYPSICRDDSLTRIADKFVRAQRAPDIENIVSIVHCGEAESTLAA
jgi:hypothetical protein